MSFLTVYFIFLFLLPLQTGVEVGDNYLLPLPLHHYPLLFPQLELFGYLHRQGHGQRPISQLGKLPYIFLSLFSNTHKFFGYLKKLYFYFPFFYNYIFSFFFHPNGGPLVSFYSFAKRLCAGVKLFILCRYIVSVQYLQIK